MDNSLLLAFTGIAAAALVIQALMMVMIGVAVLKMRRQVTEMLPRVEELVTSTKITVDQSRRQIQEVTGKVLELSGKASEILDSTKIQVAKVDALISDVSGRARVQMDRMELVLDDTMDRAQSAVSAVHRGVTRPLRELHGLAVGLRTTFAFLLRGGRPNVDQATSDEEMFI